MVVPISSGAYEYAQAVRKRLRAAKFHVEVDLRDQKMQKKVRPKLVRPSGCCVSLTTGKVG